jgi:gas vesicle protein
MTPKKTGFSFGVILGAIIGTGAVILSQSKDGKVLQKKVLNKLNQIKETYPEQAEQLENVVSEALSEARTLTKEMRQLSHISAKPVSKTSKDQSRHFVRSGKSLSSDS